MTIDPIILIILQAFFTITSAFLMPVLDALKMPYDNFVKTILGSLV